MHVTPRMAILTIVGALAYLGLAVVGEGGLGPSSAHPPLAALFLVSLALATAALFTRRNLSVGESEDRGNRWALGAFALIGLTLGYAPALSDRLNLFVVGGEGRRWVGVLLSAVGGVLRVAPGFALGGRFSGPVALEVDHQLVTDGWSLAFRALADVVLTALLIAPLFARMGAEGAAPAPGGSFRGSAEANGTGEARLSLYFARQSSSG